jgi:hypothetical protein
MRLARVILLTLRRLVRVAGHTSDLDESIMP